MKNKGVSTVIATILMLMITIGLAGVAAGYIFGWFTGEVSIITSIEDTDCNRTHVFVWVKNGGTQDIGTVNVDVEGNTCQINNLGAGLTDSCIATAPGAGNRKITVTASGAKRKTSMVYCPQ